MKQLFYISCFLLAFGVSAQPVTVNLNFGPELFLGGSNYIIFQAREYTCNAMQVHSSNGTLERFDSCTITLIPEHVGALELVFYRIENEDSVYIYTKYLRVSKLRNPTPSMYRRSSGTLSANLILHGRLELENVEHARVGDGIYFPIKEFKIVVFRDKNLVGYAQNLGAEYSPEAIALIKELKPGDEIHFIDIIGMNYYNEYVLLDALKITVK